jgi:AcrR family transcriptional regulator
LCGYRVDRQSFALGADLIYSSATKADTAVTSTVRPALGCTTATTRSPHFSARRIELAEAALETLAELGYARTSLREIAQKSEFTHGVLHYYFSDKVDLICCCVRHYKAKCVTRYDQITSAAQSRDELMRGFLEKLGETVRDEARMHRLWYDLRSQSLFEEAFRDDVAEIDQSLEDMVWRVASRFASLGGRQPIVSRGALYALFDGLFQRCLLRHLPGDRKAIADLREEVEHLLPTVA